MNRDDIIRMAREAGLKVGTNISGVTLVGAPLGDTPSIGHITIDEMERFAALVAAAEREACALTCESIARDTYGMVNLHEYGECASAIRARGKHETT